MHFCEECGQACYCHGDIDDCVVETEAYSAAHCVCDHEGSGIDNDCWDMDDEDYWDEDDEPDWVSEK